MHSINMAMFIHTIQFALALLLGYIFFVASYHKLSESDRFVEIIRGYDLVPVWAEKTALYALGLLELAVSILFLTPYSSYAAGGAIVLLVPYIFAMGRALFLGKKLADCGCGLPGSEGNESQLSVWLIARNVVLILLASTLIGGELIPSMVWIVSVPLALFFIGLYLTMTQIHQNQIKLNVLRDYY